ncbi:MAG TPA: hypothetical protein EYN66_14610 [Myxococcales bacterium]|nr:hypothetical protein [Myxococcales bacterium]
MSFSVSVNTEMSVPRFHILLAYGGTRTDFDELVAANGEVIAKDDWMGTVEGPFEVSSVEADARLARWSRRTGGLAIRITQTDNISWWMAVHHRGQRLLAMVHHFGPDSPLVQITPRLGDMELGRDPLYDLLKEPGMQPGELRRKVAERRAEQLAAALSQGGILVDENALADALSKPKGNESGIPDLFQHLGIQAFSKLCVKHPVGQDEGEMPFSIQRIIGRALLGGCIVPTGAGVVMLWALIKMFGKMGVPGLVIAVVGAWITSNTVRRLLRKRQGADQNWQDRLSLGWAAQNQGDSPGPIRPTASALDTWGGFFYLLRDIAFFSGIDRPQGAFALYIEAWAVGPPALVSYMNKVASGVSSADPLFDAAKGLVVLRDRLIEEHLQQQAINADNVAIEVRTILEPIVQNS